MFKLFLRFYVFMILLIVALVLGSNFVVMDNSIAQVRVGNALAVGSAGPLFQYLQIKLVQEPQAKWEATLQAFTPKIAHYPLEILPISQIQLAAEQMKRLQAGVIILDLHFNELGLPFAENNQDGPVAYQRIGKSDQALAYQIVGNPDTNVLTGQAWLLSLILSDLHQAQNVNVNKALQEFSKQTGVPVAIQPLLKLTPASQAFLKTHQYNYQILENFNGLPYIFYYKLNASQVLVVGPYPYPWYIVSFKSLWFIIFVLFVAFIMFISIYPFYCGLRKLERLAEQYGHGHFNDSLDIKRLSPLYRFYQNISAMGVRIKQLLSAQQELTEAVSHELKTPLARLKFAVKMNDQSEANHAINELDHMIAELLLYSSLETENAAEFKEVAIEDWLAGIVEEKKQTAPYQLQFDCTDSAKNVKLMINPFYFRKAVDNLLSNAFRYAKSRVQVILEIKQNTCFIRVADDGPGIPEAERDKIFAPFVSLDPSRNKDLSGHGLGLAIVKRIVEAHHGHIHVGSSQWGGAEFVIQLFTTSHTSF